MSSELVIELANGNTIHTDSFESNPAGSSFVRVCSPAGTEIGFWTVEEWHEDPAGVVGAILGAAHGMSDCVVCHRWLDDVRPGTLPGICEKCEDENPDEGVHA